MSGISKQQIMLIHVLTSKLGMTDDEYRAALGGYGVTTSVDLNSTQANEFVKTLTDKAVAAGVWEHERRRTKHEHIKGYRVDSTGEAMATPEQINMLDAMWSQVSREQRPAVRRKKFDRFIHNRFHRGGVRMVERDLVHKIVRALVAMGAEAP